jgi:putative FmdB family regulatory protein
MPIFEYRCAACGHLEELLQKHNDPAPAECPACGKSQTMGKELSASAFHLKGGGWSKDLYSSTSSGSTGNAASTSSGGAASSTSAGSSAASATSTSSAGSTGSTSSAGSTSSSASSTGNSSS